MKKVMILALSLFILSCNLQEDSRTKGTVSYIDLEGGFYGIILDDNTKLEPLNLLDKFKVNNLRLKFNYTEHNAVESIYMWGQPVELSDVELID